MMTLILLSDSLVTETVAYLTLHDSLLNFAESFFVIKYKEDKYHNESGTHLHSVSPQ